MITHQPADRRVRGQGPARLDNGFGYVIQSAATDQRADLGHAEVPPARSCYDTEGYIDNPYPRRGSGSVQGPRAARRPCCWSRAAASRVDLRGSIRPARHPGAVLQHRRRPHSADVNDTSLPVRVNNAGQNDRDIDNCRCKLDYDTGFGHADLDHVLRYARGDPDRRPVRLPADPRIVLVQPVRLISARHDFDQSQFLDVDAISQEMRLTSPTTSSCSWIARRLFRSPPTDSSRPATCRHRPWRIPGVRTPPSNQSTRSTRTVRRFLSDGQDNFAWAVFGNVAYEFTDQLEIDVVAALRPRQAREHHADADAVPAQRARLPAGRTGEVRDEHVRRAGSPRSR